METITRLHRLRWLAATLWLWSAAAAAVQVDIPLTLDHPFIERLLRQQVFTGPGGTLRLNDDGSGCRFLELSAPEVTSADGALQLMTDARVRIGTLLGGRCLIATDWQGRLAIAQEVAVIDGRALRLQVRDTQVLTADGRPDTVANTVWQWSRAYVAPALNTQLIDLTPQLSQLQDILAELVPHVGAGAARLAVAIGSATPTPEGLSVTLAVTAPEPTPLATAPSGPMDAAELAALQAHLEQADAFFTSIIKQAAGDAGDQALRLELLQVMLEARQRLVAILAGGERSPGDPARQWFIATWTQLAPLLSRIGEHAGGQSEILGYLSFLAAGDALRALDRLGPAFGLEISAAGLRRLARLLIRDPEGDPLRYDDKADPELRRRFGFSARLDTGVPPAAAVWLDWLMAPAQAAQGQDPAVVDRLNKWVPGRKDLDAYLPMVQSVLVHAAEQRIADGKLDPAHRPIFRRLVLAAAWQESCWRQFTAENRKRVPVHSATGDYGIMQVNARVWRGFYDLHALKWNIAANAAAGAEILLHYFQKYALRHREDRKTGDVHNLARSTYSAYNGGPSAYDRYRRNDRGKYARQVDAAFRDKYRALNSDSAEPIKGCF